ncbi:MAG: riboflavin biosynthesis protein RibF [Candidatus Dormibacteraceae bacterium]
MQVHFDMPRPRLGPTALTIGSFDGVHPGHAAVIGMVVRAARSTGLGSALLTFEPHPRCVVDPANCPKSLTTLEEKVRLFEAIGIDHLIVIQFTAALSGLPAAGFMAGLLEGVDLRHLVIGPDFALGHRRAGDGTWLRAHGAEHGYRVEVADLVRHEGVDLHSSEIRRLVTLGDMPAARKLLGRDYSIEGLVQPGDRVGRRLGFPTANIAVPPNKLVPALGAYAGRVRTETGEFAGALSVGYRPTFGGTELRVEAFLLDYEGDLYQRRIELSFLLHLHDDLKFDSWEALSARIAEDVERTRQLAGPS